MKTNKIQNNTFKAKLYTYPKTITNKSVHNKFEEMTKNFPNLTLLQDDISYVNKDHFFLMEGNKVLKFDTASFTNNQSKYTTIDEIANRFVEIFNNMLRK